MWIASYIASRGMDPGAGTNYGHYFRVFDCKTKLSTIGVYSGNTVGWSFTCDNFSAARKSTSSITVIAKVPITIYLYDNTAINLTINQTYNVDGYRGIVIILPN